MYEAYNYPSDIQIQDDGTFLVRFPDFPEALSDGTTKREAMINAIDCLQEAIAGRISDGETIPAPANRIYASDSVSLAGTLALKVALYQRMQVLKINKSELGRRLDKKEGEVRRWLDPHHNTKTAALEAALLELGQRTVTAVMNV